MPLTPSYTWNEDVDSLIVNISLPASALKTVDIYVSDLVLKINSSPYVLLLDLYDFIIIASTAIKIEPSKHRLLVTLYKKLPCIWEIIEFNGTKSERVCRRNESMDRKMKLEGELAEKRKENRRLEEKQTLRASMAVDDVKRQMLSDLKADEKEREERAMYDAFKKLNLQQTSKTDNKVIEHIKITEQRSTENRRKKAQHATERTHKKPKKKLKGSFLDDASTKPISFPSINDESSVLELSEDGSFDTSKATTSIASAPPGEAYSSKSQSKEATVVQKAVDLPPPRPPVTSAIQFSPRVFPTPTRESKAAEEEDWLLKNRHHLSKHKGLNIGASYDISESDPLWLKAKGDDFYRAKDYRSAINAYTEVIRLASVSSDELVTSCLSNRAACLLCLGEFDKCIADCSHALSYLPDTRQNEKGDQKTSISTHRLKLRLIVRRGTALCRVGRLAEAKADYGIAITMDPHNSSLEADFLQIIAIHQSENSKQAADEYCKKGDYAAAIDKYTESLRLHPQSIACLSNRAATYLMLHKYDECIEDSNNALTLLQKHPMTKTNDQRIAFYSIGPTPGSAKRREWVLKTIARRGTAHMAISSWKKAEADFTACLELDPENETFSNNLNIIKQHVKQNEETVEFSNNQLPNSKSTCQAQFA